MKFRKTNIFFNMMVPETENYDGKTGGMTRITEIVKRLNQLDSKINFIFNVTENVEKYLKNNGLDGEYKILKTNLKFKNKFDLTTKALFLLIKYFFCIPAPRANKKEERNILYASSDLFWETVPAFVYKLKNSEIEWIQVLHHLYPDWKKRTGNKLVNFFGFYFQRFSLFLIKKKADKIIVLNIFIRDDLIKRGFDRKKIHLNSNGVNPDYFDSIEKTNYAYGGIFLGRLSSSKGIYDLIEIWKKICLTFPNEKLAIIGGGSIDEKNRLSDKIIEYNLQKNIDLLGFLKDNEAFVILKSGKVFLFPSHEEGWGIAIAEAMACGVPVVSWDLPVYQEIFADYTFQIKENDKKAFADQVLKLLSDKSYREEVGVKGRDFIKKYSWEEVARKELKIIKT